MEIDRWGLTAKQLHFQLHLRDGEALLQSWSLLTTQWSSEVCWGVTDAWYLFGIGSELVNTAPRTPPNLRRSVSHYLSGSYTPFHTQEKQFAKAAKSDDAKVPIYL